MKKTLLLSVVASSFIFAGGDIAPVEPAVVTPAPVVAPAPAPVDSGWKFNGTVGLEYWTTDGAVSGFGLGNGSDSIFSQDNSSASAGVSLSAVNNDIIGGIGFGVELIGLGTLGLDEDVVANVVESGDGDLNGGAINQLYLTYGIGNTSFKVGRQTLPKSLSPLAFSENGAGLRLFNNTYEAALIVNTDISDTVLAGGWVRSANSYGDHNTFTKANVDDVIWMIAAQNKSFDGVTLTGTVYFAPDFMSQSALEAGGLPVGVAGGLSGAVSTLAYTDDLTAGWFDAGFDVAGLNSGLQFGFLDTFDTTFAVGGKIGGTVADMFNAGLAVTYVNDEGTGVFNVGGGDDNALYTTILNNNIANAFNSTTVSLVTGFNLFGENFGLAGAYSDLGSKWTDGSYSEVDFSWMKSFGALDLTAAYVWADGADTYTNDSIVKVLAKYNF